MTLVFPFVIESHFRIMYSMPFPKFLHFTFTFVFVSILLLGDTATWP